MRIKEIKSLDEASLNEKLVELKKELIKINAQIAIGTTPKNPGQVKKIKKTIARVMGVKGNKASEDKNKAIGKNILKNSEVNKKHE